jgi:hypothetical protein
MLVAFLSPAALTIAWANSFVSRDPPSLLTKEPLPADGYEIADHRIMPHDSAERKPKDKLPPKKGRLPGAHDSVSSLAYGADSSQLDLRPHLRYS